MGKQYFTGSGIDGETVYMRTRRGDIEVARFPKDAPRTRSGNGPAYDLARRLNDPIGVRRGWYND